MMSRDVGEAGHVSVYSLSMVFESSPVYAGITDFELAWNGTMAIRNNTQYPQRVLYIFFINTRCFYKAIQFVLSNSEPYSTVGP